MIFSIWFSIWAFSNYKLGTENKFNCRNNTETHCFFDILHQPPLPPRCVLVCRAETRARSLSLAVVSERENKIINWMATPSSSNFYFGNSLAISLTKKFKFHFIERIFEKTCEGKLLTKNTPFRAVCLRVAADWGLSTLVILLAQVFIFGMANELMEKQIRVIYKIKLIVNSIINVICSRISIGNLAAMHSSI